MKPLQGFGANGRVLTFLSYISITNESFQTFHTFGFHIAADDELQASINEYYRIFQSG